MPAWSSSSTKFSCLPKELRERIRRVSPRATACWLWLGPVSYQGRPGDLSVGYGRQSWPIVVDEPTASTTNWLAHKLIYTLLEGPVPNGLVLDHLKERCTARRCVRPDHLEPVTMEENTRRGGGRYGSKRFLKSTTAARAPAPAEFEDEVPF